MALSNLSPEEEQRLRDQFEDDDDGGGGGRFGGGDDTTGGRPSEDGEPEPEPDDSDDSGGGGRFSDDPTGGRPADDDEPDISEPTVDDPFVPEDEPDDVNDAPDPAPTPEPDDPPPDDEITQPDPAPTPNSGDGDGKLPPDEPEPEMREEQQRDFPEPDPQQGLEETADESKIQDQSAQFEQEFLSEQDLYDAEDVRVVREDEDTLGLELTSTGREVATAEQLNLREEDIFITKSGEVRPTSRRGRDEFAIRGIEAAIAEKYPYADRFSISAVEGKDVFEVDVTTGEGEEVEFITGEDAPTIEEQTAAELGVTTGDIDIVDGEVVPTSESGEQALTQGQPSPQDPTAGLNQGTPSGVGRFADDPTGARPRGPRGQATQQILSQIESETGADLTAGDIDVEQITLGRGNTRFQGDLTESGERKVQIATGQRPEGDKAFTEATTSGGLFDEETEQMLAERSENFQEFAGNVGETVANFGPSDLPFVEDDALQESDLVGAEGQTRQERLFEGAITSTVGFLDPFQAAKTGETGIELAQSVANEEVGFEELATSGLAVGAFTASEVSDAFTDRPQEVGGSLLGSVGAGFAAGAAAPVRFSKIKIPDTEGGTQTIRAAQLGYPGGTRQTLTPGATAIKTRPTKFQTPTKTVVGARGKRPSIGTPKADIDTVDFTAMGTRADDAFEPTGQLETQVFRKTFKSEGADTEAARIGAVRDLMKTGKKSQSKATLQITSAEDIARRVEGVPEGEAARVAQKIQDVDASIFGSAATEAQLPGFRKGVLENPAPKDIDVVVPDEAAKAELKAFESDIDADIFDIKLEEDVPGRAAGNQPIKFGQRSQPMLQTEEGVPVNPASEELLRKAGASGFFRGTDAPQVGKFDVGPQPVRPGRLSTREKDVLDAIAMGEELVGPETTSVMRFREAFEDVEGVRPVATRTSVTDRLGIKRFLDDTRAQTGGSRPRGDIDTNIPDTDDVVRRLDDADDASPSPTRGTDIELTRPSAGASAALGATGAQPTSPSATTSPAETDFLSPVASGVGGDGMGSPSGVGAIDTSSPITSFSPGTTSPGIADITTSPSGIDVPGLDSPGTVSGGGGSPGSPTGTVGSPGSGGGGDGVPSFTGPGPKPQKDDNLFEREDDTESYDPDEFATKFESLVATPDFVLNTNLSDTVLNDDA